MNSLMDYILNPRGQAAAQPSGHNISDEESLEEHSGLEDFQGVILQLDGTGSTEVSRSPTPGTPFGGPGTGFGQARNMRYEEERLQLFGVGASELGKDDCSSNGLLPKIAITPVTPPSEIGSPGANSTISLSSSVAPSSPFKHLPGKGEQQGLGCYWKQNDLGAAGPLLVGCGGDEAKDFFACRDSIMHKVVEEVQNLRDSKMDGEIRGTWLLTEIDHWDNEKERVVLICAKSIIIVKYDFIGMRVEEHRRIFLCIVDTIIQGELKYPEKSLTPRISGIAGGLAGVLRGCIIPKVQESVTTVGCAVLYKNTKPATTPLSSSPDCVEATEDFTMIDENELKEEASNGNQTSIMSALSLENFEPRVRSAQGIRIMWNQDLPLSFTQKWNPFNKSIPMLTFTSHPLFWHKGGGEATNRSFDVDAFAREFIDILSQSGGDSSPVCRVEYKPIIIETYVGLASLIHNAHNLGFYKVRGKVSF